MEDDDVFGCDYSSLGQVTAKGDIETVSGLDNAKQNIKNWLLTEKGFYPNIDTEYGSEIYNIFGEDFEEENIDALQIYIRNALLENPRVLEITRLEPYVTIDKKIRIIINIILVNGTSENLNISINEEV